MLPLNAFVTLRNGVYQPVHRENLGTTSEQMYGEQQLAPADLPLDRTGAVGIALAGVLGSRTVFRVVL